MKPLSRVKLKWSSDFAYAVGLIVTDGNLSPDGRHVVFVSKDLEMVENLQKTLGIKCSIGRKGNGANPEDKKYYVLQIGDVCFYNFLLEIGLIPKKSKIIGEVLVPKKYFFDFLRGHLDGDGTFYYYWDPRWRSSLMFYTSFNSASREHIKWLRKEIADILGIKGHVTHAAGHSCYQLKYAKVESLKLLKKLYYSPKIIKLTRKYLKILEVLSIMEKN